MTSEKLHDMLEQNQKNLKALLDALDADYEYPDTPGQKAKRAAYFGDSGADPKEAELSDGERVAWMFEQIAKAIAAAAEAAGVSNRATETGKTGALTNYSGVFVPPSEVKRDRQKRDIRFNREG